MKQLFFSDLWQAKPTYVVSLKSSLNHFFQYLENEERVHRAVGGLTTALGSIMKALDYDLSMLVRTQKAKCRTARAVKDAQLIEQWVGSDIWKEMVLKSMQGLRYIHEHKDDPGFWTKWVHQLSNQFLSVIIFLNCYPGRCGGWELIARDDMLQQLANENLGNVLKFARHKTALTYGPLKKWAPESLLKALRMYSELPLGPSEYFWTPHTKAQTLIVSHVLQCACVTVGHKGAVPSTNFVRKLFTSLVSSGESVDSITWNTAIDELAKIDAHSAAMARSIHYDVSDMIDGGVIKKSVRAFLSVMKRLPVDFPEERIGKDEFDHLLANMGKRGVKRPEEDDIDFEDHAALVERRMPAKQRRRLLRQLIRSTAETILDSTEGRMSVSYLCKLVVRQLESQGVAASFFQVRYAIVGS